MTLKQPNFETLSRTVLVLGFMAQTGGDGKNFIAWQDELANNIPGWDKAAFTTCLENFCQRMASVDGSFRKSSEVFQLSHCDTFLDVVMSTQQHALPKLWDKAEEEFERQLLEKARFFEQFQDKFLPSLDRVGGSFFKDCYSMEVPAREFDILNKMKHVLLVGFSPDAPPKPKARDLS